MSRPRAVINGQSYVAGYLILVFERDLTRTRILICVSLSFIAATSATQHMSGSKNARQFSAPDGSVRVQIVPVGKEAASAAAESRLEFKSNDGKIACILDYSSEDSEHGFGVVKAEWTPDSQYFVFSLSSSGGHQAWHAPTEFLSRKDGVVRSLDDYFEAAGVSNADFHVEAPHTVTTEVWVDKDMPVSIDLAHLPPLRSWRKSKPFSVACTGGRTHKIATP